jgi:hypothetical protein
MKLSLRATRIVLEALEHYQQNHDDQLRQESLSEEEISDLSNDREYLQAIKQDFEKYRDELMEQKKTSAVTC